MKPVLRTLLAFTATACLVGLSAVPASAAVDPAPETKTVITHLVDRDDHGHGTPPPAVWALDTFTRVVTITGGPFYVLPTPEDTEDTVAAKIAETKQLQPNISLCDLVKYLHLKWNYHAEVKDDGTFLTKAGDTLSPNDGLALVGDVPGTMTGTFTADFQAAAHWCSFDASDLDDETVQGDDAPSTSTWVSSMFGEDFKGSSINEDWTWTYKTCVEKWWDAADEESNDGTTEAAGDITGKPCPTTPAPTTPVPTTQVPVVETAQLPVTGASVTVFIATGAGLVLLGAAMLAGLYVARRRRTA